MPDGQCNAKLASLAGSMRRKGLSGGAIEAPVQIIKSRSCNPGLPENEVRTIATSVSRYP